ncbi:hypothetical protein LAZ67_4000839 [Cordylochernes scorpioides]|uniref:Integrase catalytic domain-containing protein n=1 Tax=Cordylochernes scorpioides TaxID=51811 RepID=A0ABY6KBH7_9ARAC|nr:hypothetical protein LAZ67_4000839 [Cordylochernes scorpioides]
MEDASMEEQEKLLRLPNYLVRQPLELFRKLRLADRSYFQVRQILLDLYPESSEASFAKYFAMKLTGQANLETYYREKTAMGLQLGLPQEVILETLTEGLPFSDQRLVRVVPPENLGEWFRLVQRIHGPSVPATRSREDQPPTMSGPYHSTSRRPDALILDNAPTFNSREFEKCLKKNGIRHICSAAYHPASNGQVERDVQTIKTRIKEEHRNEEFTLALDRVLFGLRNTPNRTTKRSPAELLMGRQNVHDDERSGRPVTATDNAAVADVRNVVKADRRVTIDEMMIRLPPGIEIGRSSIGTIIDFHLFPALKLHLGGKHFANDDEVQAETNHWLRRQDTAWYNSGIKNLLQRYQKCSDRNGDYVEK